MDFINYLESNNVIVVKNILRLKKLVYSNEEIKEHIDLIIKVQEILNNYDPKYFYTFKSFVWKKPEHFYKSLKLLKRQYAKLLENGPENEYEELILSSAAEYIDKADRACDNLRHSKYKVLIKRSMLRKEIALGKVSYDNLYMDEKIKIKDIKSIGYNMLEMDIIQFLSKIKKRISINDLIQFIEYFCSEKGLSSISENFILTMLSYPSKYIKHTLRYFENPAYYVQNTHIDKFKNALLLDGESLYEYF
ncbi:MAG: hypothetical protein FWC47_04185 [Oscillospiraceae bacterium]|nr:hypothetical protein [Oscillospiraceae bacterium]